MTHLRTYDQTIETTNNEMSFKRLFKRRKKTDIYEF